MRQDIFVSAIEAIRLQLAQDRDYSFTLAKVLGAEDMPLYDNSLLIGNIIALIQTHFVADVKEDIEHFCFQMNFGKIGEDTIMTTEELYNKLAGNGIWYHTIINASPQSIH